MGHEKRYFAIIPEGCLAADDPKNAVDAVTRKKLEKARQKNRQARIAKSLAGRIQKLEAKLAIDDNIPHRDDLEARLAKLRADQKTSHHQHDRSPHHLAARIKWMENRVERNPSQPEFRARLDHLLTKVPIGVVIEKMTTTTKGSPRGHRLDRVEARIHVQEKRLKNSPDGQNRVQLELKLSKQYDLKEKLMRRKLQQEQLDHRQPSCRRREKPAVLLLQRIRKLERLLNRLDNAEERLALEDRLDRLRHNLGRHDNAGPAGANDEEEGTMEIVEQVKNIEFDVRRRKIRQTRMFAT
jgi:hypothetical protein